MPKPILERLRIRLGFKAAEVAAAGGWTRTQYGRIERGEELDVEDALRLTDLFGVDIDGLLTRGKVGARDVPIATLLKGRADDLTADARFGMTEALAVARDIRELEQELSRRPAYAITRFREDDDLRHPEQGNATRLASMVRDALGLEGVIRSVISDVCTPLGVLVFATRFNDRYIDAFSTWSPSTGPLIVVNADSPRTNGVLGLRTTIAHEICHLCFDRRKMRDISTFCEIDRSGRETTAEPIERRARAFQVELLAPKSAVLDRYRATSTGDIQSDLRALCEHFGIGPVGMSHQLHNAGGPGTAIGASVLSVACASFAGWSDLQVPDEPTAIPPFRRGRLLELVREGFESDSLSASTSRELLRVGVADWDELATTWRRRS